MGAKIGKKGPIADINVTPLVDVMLVLLVIFMITAPLMFNGIKLTLPKTKEVNRLNLSAKQVILSITRTEEYYLNKDRYLLTELVPAIQIDLKKTKTDTLYLRADYGIRYGKVAKLMSHLKQEGIEKIALITETEGKKN
jgi:biopolymer transport protein ExbD